MKTLKKSLAVILSLILITGSLFVTVYAEDLQTPYEDSHFYHEGDYSIHYRIVKAEGVRKGRIMFLHGFIYSGSTWDGAAEIMSREGYDCYLLDIPNYGYSTRENENTNLIPREDLIVNLMKTIAPLDQWILAGHSMGGGIALNIACDHPELKKLMLFCPSEINMSNGGMIKFFNNSTVFKKLATLFLNCILKCRLIVKSAVFFVTKDWNYAKNYDTNKLTAPLLIDGTIPGIFYSTANARHTDLDAISKIKTPVLLVWADKDSVINEDMKANITNALPNASVQTIKGSHIVIETDPQGIADLMMNFLNGK